MNIALSPGNLNVVRVFSISEALDSKLISHCTSVLRFKVYMTYSKSVPPFFKRLNQAVTTL